MCGGRDRIWKCDLASQRRGLCRLYGNVLKYLLRDRTEYVVRFSRVRGRYFLNDHSAVGFGVPIIFRNADYLIPGDDQGYANASSVDGVSYFNFGANIKYYYDISKRFQFSMGFGGILGSGALSWSNGVRFYF